MKKFLADLQPLTWKNAFEALIMTSAAIASVFSIVVIAGSLYAGTYLLTFGAAAVIITSAVTCWLVGKDHG